MTTERVREPLTYGAYLRVPELLDLQAPLGHPAVHDELLFIIVQQSQELWFKQVLHDLRAAINMIDTGNLPGGVRLLQRAGRVLCALGQEVEVMETLSPVQFQQFRHLLTPSSGFESEQFRLLELVSGLGGEAYHRIAARAVDLDAFRRNWPRTLRDAFLSVVTRVDSDPVRALMRVYMSPDENPAVHSLAEACSEYEMRFLEWRFHHLALVERIIGNRSPGTAGSSGTAYLSRTLGLRFFPELWEARNRITERGSEAAR